MGHQVRFCLSLRMKLHLSREAGRAGAMTGRWHFARQLVAILLAYPLAVHALPESAATPGKTMTVQGAVDYAMEHYPSVRAALENLESARASVGVAKTSYVPRLDAVWQGDRGTRNSVLGVLLPQSPNILTGTQGTVLPSSGRPFWTSGGGVLFSWEPYDFGYRSSQVREAGLAAKQASAQINLTRLDVAGAVVQASLALLGEEQRGKVAQADVDRRTVFGKSVHARVDAHLRPGADASRADAELAAATTGLYLAEESLQVARAELAELLGLTGSQLEIEPDPYLGTPPSADLPAGAPSSHPAAVAEQDRVAEVQGRISVLNHQYYPHFTLEALSSGRGSGENSKGKIAPGLNGLGTDVHNWEAGLTASLPIADIAGIHERKKEEVANLRREQALYEQTLQDLAGQQAKAEAGLEWARHVAENTPTQLRAARESEAQARARFEAGLGTIVDVAEAQRLLVQAETDDALARLAVWRALAGVASAEGDLVPFFDFTRSAPTGGK